MYSAFELSLANVALGKALRITGQKLGNVQLVNRRVGYLEIAAQRGFAPEFLDCFRRVKSDDASACGRALLFRDIVVIDDVTEDPQFSPFLGIAERAGFQIGAINPAYLVERGSPWGYLNSRKPQPRSEPARTDQIIGARNSQAQLPACVRSWPRRVSCPESQLRTPFLARRR